MIAWPNRKLVYACAPIFILFALFIAGVQQPVYQNYSNGTPGNFSFSYNHLPVKKSFVVTNGNAHRIVNSAFNAVDKSRIATTGSAADMCDNA